MIANNSPKLATEADRTIGSRIAAFLAAQGLSQTALGHAIGVSFQQVQKYKKGRNRIGAGRLQAIADLLQVPVETFFADQSEIDAEVSDVRAYYNNPKVVELVTTFMSIADDTTRDSILSIVKAAATIQQRRADQA